MAIEIIPKEAIKAPPWQNILFYISIALVLGCISGYFVLNYFTNKSDIISQDLGKALAETMTPQRIDLEKEISNYQAKINDFGFLLLNHKKGSNFFEFFEKVCHPKVFFSDINLNIKEDRLNISGKTESFEILEQQILILKNEEKFRRVQLSDIRIGKGGKIEFDLEIFLDPTILAW